MANLWFKFYGGDFLSDPKIERLTPAERSCWVTLLCLASMNGSGEIEFLTIESLLNKSGIQYDPYNPKEWENAVTVLNKFQKMKMITLDDDKIQILNWEKRQERNLTPAERMAKMRAKNKNQSVTSDVTNVTLEKKRKEKNRKEYIKSEVKTSSQQKISFSQEDLELSNLLFDLILKNTPTAKKPNLDNWANVIRLMRQNDNRTYEQIKFVIEWSQQDNFWSANILSTKKLREKFDTLVSQIRREAEKNKIKKSNILV